MALPKLDTSKKTRKLKILTRKYNIKPICIGIKNKAGDHPSYFHFGCLSIQG